MDPASNPQPPADYTPQPGGNTTLPAPTLPLAPLEMAPPSSSQPLAAMPMPLPLPSNKPARSTSAADDPGGRAAPIVTPSVSDDPELIEKEWVERAKRIVQSTMDNPYEQSKELSNLRAEYMKKHYNKDLRPGE